MVDPMSRWQRRAAWDKEWVVVNRPRWAVAECSQFQLSETVGARLSILTLRGLRLEPTFPQPQPMLSLIVHTLVSSLRSRQGLVPGSVSSVAQKKFECHLRRARLVPSRPFRQTW
jgi:hypothetical protein